MSPLRRWQALACLSLLAHALILSQYAATRYRTAQPRIRSVVFKPASEGSGGTFTVRFTTPMDTDAALPGELPVSFAPPVRGKVVWENHRTAVILPESPVQPGQNYRVVPRLGLRDREGRELSAAAASLRVEPLELVTVGEPVRLGERRSGLALHFSGTVRSTDLLRYLRLRTADGEPLTAECDAAQPTAAPVIEFEHPRGLKSIVVRLAEGLPSADGTSTLGREVQAKRELDSALRISSLTSEPTGDAMRLLVTSTTAVDTDAALGFVTVTPAVGNLAASIADWGWHGGRWAIAGEFQPRTYYRVLFRKGLPAAESSLRLQEDVVLGVVTGDLGPILELDDEGGSGLVLPARRAHLIPATFRNLERAEFRAHRVYPNNLVAWSRCRGESWRWEQMETTSLYGHFVGKVTLVPGLAENQRETLHVPLDPLLKEYRHGLFALSLQSTGRSGYGWSCRTLLLTDIGVGAVSLPGSVAVWTLSLKDGTPLAGSEIEVLSAKNQLLARGNTGADGTALLAIAPGPPEERAPFLVVARQGDDLAYVRADAGSSRDLTPFRLEGRGLPEHPYEALVSTERGIARPGETIVAEVILRTAQLEAAAGVPLEIRLQDPRGNVVERIPATTSPNGLAVRSLQLPVNSLLGHYALQATLPGDGETVWGETALVVGEYRPDRIRCSLKLDRERYAAGGSLVPTLSAQYYYGAAVAQGQVRFRLLFDPAPFEPEGFGDFVFGDEDRQDRALAPMGAQTETDALGNASVRLALHDGIEARAALRITVAASVTVPGGETVTATAAAPFDPVPYYLGIRLAADSALPAGSTPGGRAFDWLAVDPGGSLRANPAGLTWELLAVDWDYVLRQGAEGRYVRDWQRVLRPVSSGTVRPPTADGKGRLEVSCPGPGLYALRLTAEGGRIQSALHFWHLAGGGGVARVANPAVLPLKTDRPVYSEGDQAAITVESPAAGQAVVTVLAAHVEKATVQAVQAGTNVLEVTVPRTPLGSCAIGVTLVVPEEKSSEFTRRLFGLAALSITHDDRRLGVEIDAPAVVRPAQALPVALRLSTGGAPQAGTVLLLAVDEGVLALTNHRTPDPFGYFHGPRRCQAQFADLYGEVCADTAGLYGTISPVGGDGMGAFLARLKPEDVRHAVIASREIEVDAGGRAEVALDVPDYTGELRLMAVAVNPRSMGSADRAVKVRSPLAVLASAPRAVAPGDTFRVSAVVTSETGTGQAKVAVTLSGPARVTSPEAVQVVALGPGSDGAVSWACQAADAETGRVSLTIRAESGEHTRGLAEFLLVRPAGLPTYRNGFERVMPGRAFSPRLGEGFIAGSANLTAQVAASNRVETTAALAWLVAYPYGCLEQTVSRAMASVALPGLFPSPAGTGPVAEALRAMAASELPAGGFAMWPGSDTLWLSGSLYACHFLCEAERTGATVDPALKARTLAFLRNAVLGRATGGDVAVGDRAYALYLLAALGHKEVDLARAVAAPADEAALVRLLAAAALVRSGQPGEGMPVVERVLRGDVLEGRLGWDMDSDVRRVALALCVVNDTCPDHPAADRLTDLLRRRRSASGHWDTTQNNALAVLALARRRPEPGNGTALVDLGGGGETRRVAGAEVLSLGSSELAAGLTVSAEGGPVFLAWQERGVPAVTPTAEVRDGIAVRRQYLTIEGKPAARVRHGDLVQVRLTLETPLPRDNVVVADLLPGGFEIEDASLATRQAVAPTSGLTGLTGLSRLGVNVAQRQDDRLVLCADIWSSEAVTYEYHVRAVTRGDFAIPRVRAEAMYDPAVAGESGGTGRIVIE
jgi:uncharacterized protein YfaS (alpha-2-macroglobulin family)